MPKATLTFDLSDSDERRSHLEATNVSDIIMVAYDLDDWLRDEVKYNDKLTEERLNAYETVREKLHQLANDSGVSNLIFE